MKEAASLSSETGNLFRYVGLTLEYNSGAVEGTVNRIKQLKSAMYGRAKPDLLRKRILLA